MSTHPADFARQLEQSNWFNRMKDADMTRQEQTARPQDVALLPLPSELDRPHLAGLQGVVQDYARANVTAALASAQAREEELRAEGVRIERENREGWKQAAHWRGRAERLEEALRAAWLDLEQGIDQRIVIAAIRAALSTNAATQTGETT